MSQEKEEGQKHRNCASRWWLGKLTSFGDKFHKKRPSVENLRSGERIAQVWMSAILFVIIGVYK